MYLLGIFVFSLFSKLNAEISVRNCEPIRIELCRGIGYNETSMPNLVGHELQSDADFTLQTFLPLIQYGCSAQLHFFLCAAYVPMCTPKVPVPIGPCRGLCETVRARCHPVLQGFGFPWPTALDCNRFPKENNHEEMCMEGPGESSGGIGGGSSMGIGLSSPTTKIVTHRPSCQGLAKSHLYVKLNRTGTCAPLCEADILFDQREKSLAELWVTAWSVAALMIAILATLCLIVSDTKWDKILMPLVTCHSLVAVGWAIRWLAGRNQTACGMDPQLPGVSLLLTDGLSNAPCAATFLLRYYFGMSASVWWAILCMKWHFTVRRARNDSLSDSTGGGDKNSDQTYSSLAQLAAWGLPALQTVSVLVARLVDADELLGACYVGNQSDKALRVLVAMPIFCYWIFGSVNLFAGYLVQRRKFSITSPATMHCNGSLSTTTISSPTTKNCASYNHNFVSNLNGMGTFLFIYCVPSAFLMIAVFYEFANRDLWLNDPQPSLQPTAGTKAPLWPFMLRAYMELLVGVLASGWTLGPRLSSLWKSKFGVVPPTPVKCKPAIVKYPTSAYSCSASYQTVCPQNSMVSIASSKLPKHGRKYPPAHVYRKARTSYKSSSQSISLTGNETVL